MSRVWFITGSSTGFGRSLTEAVLKRGERVVATARNKKQIEEFEEQYTNQAIAVKLDVTDPQEVRAAVKQAIEVFGQIDVLVNNAGYGTIGAIEEVSDEDVRKQYETNVFGALDVIRAVLPHMRQQRSGHILNISSVVGQVSFAGAGIYSSTKFALESLSEALAKEVAPLGIRVTIVEPGAFRTDFAGRSLLLSDTIIEDYASTVGDFRQRIRAKDGNQPGDPNKAVLAMIQVVESENPPLRLPLGADSVAAIEEKLLSIKNDVNNWREVAINTAFEDAVVTPVG
ncbi:MAG: SDR family NAD(P)-dependent oxidoreductase [Blastocatellia bacterium]|nr:SDR family NAD(P)-dependent oxidoreductase [Blastocatellia bacterium]